MKSSKIKVNAKINLTLNITGNQGNFHLLDTLTAPIAISDAVFVREREDKLISLRIHGMDAPVPEENNAYKAAKAFMGAFGTNGADIVIHKDIPLSGGLGGSSADIAGVLLCMKDIYGVREDVKPLADALSSDGGYMLNPCFARLKGKGEIVEELGIKRELHLAVVYLEEGVSAAECFKRYDEAPDAARRDTDNCIKGLLSGDLDLFYSNIYNALYKPAVKILPKLEKVREDMLALSPECVSMSGSGSCMFSIYDTSELARRAVKKLKRKYRCFYTTTV